MPNARSIHIGLNHVDPDAYNGWDGELSGCINDANDMQSIASSLGYTSTVLIDSEATSCRVISEIGQAADELESGDILFLTYSGHGGEVDDVNGDEDSGLDQTWCLWERQLVDDELYCLWSRFKPNVRVVVLSDSCHSGTVLRMVKTLESLKQDMKRTRGVPGASNQAAINVLEKALSISPTAPATDAKRDAKQMQVKTGGISVARTPSLPPVRRPRRMPADVQEAVNRSHADINASAQWMAGPSDRANINATILLISGCQDDQLSADGSGNGLFTEKLKAVWNDGAYSGNYKKFWNDIRSSMPANQQPNYLVVGRANPGFEAQTPFDISALPSGGSVPVSPPNEPVEPVEEPSEPSTGVSRPTLRQGASGGDVEYLQQRLVDHDHNITVDGVFGPGTASAVRAFQSANGLKADGVVGPATWTALG